MDAVDGSTTATAEADEATQLADADDSAPSPEEIVKGHDAEVADPDRDDESTSNEPPPASSEESEPTPSTDVPTPASSDELVPATPPDPPSADDDADD